MHYNTYKGTDRHGESTYIRISHTDYASELLKFLER